MLCAPVDVVGQHGQDLVQRGLVERGRGAVRRQRLVGALAVGELVGLWDPEEGPDGAQRHFHAELTDDVELLATGQRVERTYAEAADEGLEVATCVSV